MRLPSVSVAMSGMANVSTVAMAPMAANTIAMKRASSTCVINMSSMAAAQKSKLIILRMTKTPINIQRAQPTSMNWPVGCVHKSSMYCGLVM